MKHVASYRPKGDSLLQKSSTAMFKTTDVQFWFLLTQIRPKNCPRGLTRNRGFSDLIVCQTYICLHYPTIRHKKHYNYLPVELPLYNSKCALRISRLSNYHNNYLYITITKETELKPQFPPYRNVVFTKPKTD